MRAVSSLLFKSGFIHIHYQSIELLVLDVKADTYLDSFTVSNLLVLRLYSPLTDTRDVGCDFIPVCEACSSRIIGIVIGLVEVAPITFGHSKINF